MRKDERGFLVGEAYVARSGIQKYYNEDGSERLELRHPDDVFTEKYFDSLKNLPIVMLHPNEHGDPDEKLITAENAKKYSIGFTGEKAGPDGKWVKVNMTITDGESIELIESGELKELSLGYLSDTIEEAGVFDNEPFTHRQTNLRNNHLALVPAGRAGAKASINLDGNQVVKNLKTDKQEKKEMNDKTFVTVNLDGLNYDASPEVAKALEKVRTNLDSERKEKTELQQKYDSLEAERDDLKVKVDKAEEEKKDADEKYMDNVKKAAKEMMDALKKVGDLVGEEETNDAEEEHKNDSLELKKFALKQKIDGIKLDGKSEDYINARFDALYEQHKDSIGDNNVHQTFDSGEEYTDGLSKKGSKQTVNLDAKREEMKKAKREAFKAHLNK